MLNVIMSMMIIMSLIMLYLNHPLSMGLILIIQTMMTAVIVGYMMSSFLFSYIIMMIMLSGVLVLFIYMSSIASNEKFNSPIKMMAVSLLLFIIINYYMFMYNNMNMMNNLYMNEIISLIKIFNTMTAQITMMMIMYLLLTMIVVSNIAKVTEGPLRMKS
uniref:NADH-ubiquinone oxidoreductase chain 6 n=1 Tax=Palomena viridissima TaxID=763224 RepID=A0A7D5GAU8_9HEMI|nr:NADH dehydrogenase subunit 6 [Palomena viridissima]QLF99783.1 NADH dehydrogenase subunit 6 [Palomena viridissima]